MVRHRKKRTARVPVRCTPEEKPIWERVADEQDMDLSDYIVRLVRADIQARQRAAAQSAAPPVAPEPSRAAETPAVYVAPPRKPPAKRRPKKRR